MKSYTDLDQSRKLAKLLPLEGADMCYYNDGTAIKIDANSYPVRYLMWKDYYVEVIPCWSLAALINILASNTNQVRISGSSGYWVCEPLFADINKYSSFTDANNLVDACFNMIIRLKEKNLI